MDILYIVTKSGMGGASRYVYDLASKATKENRVRVAAGGDGALFDKLREQHIETISIPYLERDIALLKEVKVFFFLVNLLVKETPDVVHLNSPKIGGLGALAARIAGVKKIIYTAHGWPFYEDRPAAQKSLIKFASWITILLSTNTVAVSKKDAHAFDAWLFTQRKVMRIPNGVQKPVLTKVGREEYRIPKDASVVGLIAELHKNKGIEYLIKAAENVHDATFVIVGEGEDRVHLEKRIEEKALQNRFLLLGHIPDAQNMLPLFDVFVLPSIKEGLPYVLLEAGIQGLPVVASNVGGVPDIIEHEKNGLLIEPKSPEALANAIQKLIKNEPLRTQLGAALKEKVREEFSLNQTIQKTTALY